MTLNIQNNFNSQIKQVQTVKSNAVSNPAASFTAAVKPNYTPSFRAAQAPATIRTELASSEEKKKYSQVASALGKNDRKKLEILLKNGRLLNSDSNDKSTTLDNLYKIITVQRADGLDAKNILKETVNIITDPYVITQKFGDIPQRYMKDVVEIGKANEATLPQDKADVVNEQTVNVSHSGCCVAASIEFSVANSTPAEFARIAEGLSSPSMAAKKTIQTKNLANNTLDAVWLLNAFEIPYKMDNFDKAELTLAPDKNAIIRARIQNKFKDESERSLVDVLMQSTFMQIGSQQSYDSLTDVRRGKFNQNDRGLIEFEKTFTESVVEDKNKISVTYQTVDDDAKLVGYETDFNTMKKHILDSLNMGESVIIGYTQIDEKNTIINGHEITIVGAKQDANGKLIFICNDTDDNQPKAIEYSEDYLLPKIHHAGLPQKVVESDVQFVDNWVDGINAYKEAKKKQQSENANMQQQIQSVEQRQPQMIAESQPQIHQPQIYISQPAAVQQIPQVQQVQPESVIKPQQAV